MGAIPTITVKNKQGHVMTINVEDFDPKIHKSLDEVAEAPPKKVFAEDVEAKVTAAKTKAALQAIAKQYSLELSDEQAKGTLHEIRGVLLPQILKKKE